MTLADDLNRSVTIAVPVRRVVSLAPAATENLFAVEAGNLVVGVTTADDYPPAVNRLTRVGDFYQPVMERIRALRPDLVVVESGTAKRADMDALQKRLGAPLYVMQSLRFADVDRQLRRLGRITGHERDAERQVKIVAAKAAQVEKRVRNKRPVSVFIQIDTSALYAAGPGSFMDDLIRRAGGVNVVRGTNPYPLVSREFLLAANPEHYIVTVAPGMPGKPALAPRLRGLSAVKNGRVHYMDANLLSRATPRLADGLAALAALLHP